jgi:hypothetical protein
MNDVEPIVHTRETAMPTVGPYVATWRYIGDRDAADRAYCARFGVAVAPEPSIALGGALAYTVPIVERPA